jgi:hypothetical protein
MNALPSVVLSKQFKTAKELIKAMDIFFATYHRTAECFYMNTFICNWWNYNKSNKAITKLIPLLDLQRSLELNYKNALVNNDTKEMCRYILMIQISLGEQKEDIIRAFSYNTKTGKFNRQHGIDNWNKITEGLIIPELKSVGIPPKE